MTFLKKPWVKKTVHVFLSLVLTAILIAVFYLAVVLGQPTADEDDVTVADAASQPLLSPSPAESITAESQLTELISHFPTPVLSFVAGTGPTLIAASSYDTAFENGFARILDLTYTMEDGGTVQLRTIYPARALSLIDRGDYHLNQATSLSMAGLKAVKMENQSTIRLHAQGTEALYVVTLPQMSGDEISSLMKGMQLNTKTGEESSTGT